MKYPYSVKHNGKYYRPNVEIPDDIPVKTIENSVETTEKAPAKKTTKKAAKEA